MLYSLDEICLFPAIKTKIEHRGDVNVFTDENNYPIFTAPMASIVDNNNYQKLKNHKLNIIIPRSVAWETRLKLLEEEEWVAVGFKEAEWLLKNLKDINDNHIVRLCIDQANGHMESLLTLCKKFKEKFGNKIKIMTGNIANPNTYRQYAKVGIDYIRVGIGGGNVCFPAGTKIKTLSGEKNIENIQVGEKVLTLFGEKNVKNVFKKSTSELITINNDIKCTPNHKFLVIYKKDKDIVNENNINNYSFYIEAKNLNDDYLLVQAYNA